MKMNYQMIAVVFLALGFGACRSKEPVQEIKTELEGPQRVGQEKVGKNSDGKYVLQKKEEIAAALVDLQREVYAAEESIYGNKTYGNKGKFGVLEDCRIELRAKTNGKWEMVESAPKVILSQEESKITKKIGLDEKGKLVLLTEEELTARMKRFERYRQNYERQEEWYDTEIKACKVALTNYVKDKSLPAKEVEAQFPDYALDRRSDMNAAICQYVESGASLKSLVKAAVAGGWILEEDLTGRADVNGEIAKDGTDFRRSGVFRLGDWALAYDSRQSYGDLMNTDQDAGLEAWLNRNPEAVKERSSCLPNGKRWSTARK